MTTEKSSKWILSTISENDDASVIIFEYNDTRFDSRAKSKRVIALNNIHGRLPSNLLGNGIGGGYKVVPKGSCHIIFYDQLENPAPSVKLSEQCIKHDANISSRKLDEFLNHHTVDQSYTKLHSKEDWKFLLKRTVLEHVDQISLWSGLRLDIKWFTQRYSDFGYNNGIIEVSASQDYFPQRTKRFHFAYGPGSGSSLIDRFTDDVFDYFFSNSTLIDTLNVCSVSPSFQDKYNYSYRFSRSAHKPKQIQEFRHRKIDPLKTKRERNPVTCGELIIATDATTLGGGSGQRDIYAQQSLIYDSGIKWRKDLALIHEKKIWIPKINGIDGCTEAFGEIYVSEDINNEKFYVQLTFFYDNKTYSRPDLPDNVDAYGIKFLTVDEIEMINTSTSIEGAELEFDGVLDIFTTLPSLLPLQAYRLQE